MKRCILKFRLFKYHTRCVRCDDDDDEEDDDDGVDDCDAEDDDDSTLGGRPV